MTTTTTPHHDTDARHEQATHERPTADDQRQRELWEAYRQQQQRRHCPSCGESCDAIV